MRFHHMCVAALAVVSPLASVPSVDAFTYGPYLPSYLCGPTIPNPVTGTLAGVDGTPKALAGVLAKFSEFSPTMAAAENTTYNPNLDPRLWVAVMHSANTQGKIAPFTAGVGPFVEGTISNTATAQIPGIITTAQTNILRVAAITTPVTIADIAAANLTLATTIPAENAYPAATTTTIQPNKVVTLSLHSQNNILGAVTGGLPLPLADFNNAGDKPVLDGAIVFAQDAKNNRVGKFPSGGPNMVPWAACGPDSNGIVHTQLLSPDTNVYNGATFFIPWQYSWANPGNVPFTMMGAAVTDNGFGYHQTTWTLQGLPPLPVTVNFSPAKTGLNPKDYLACANLVPSLACRASCYDCALKGGSTPLKQTNTAAFSCVHDPATGNPAMGQFTVWTATCKINGVVTPVVPAGTLPQVTVNFRNGDVLKTLDANGNDVTVTQDQMDQMDTLAAQIVAVQNGTLTDTDLTQMSNTPTTAPTTAPTTCTTGKSVNAATSTTISLFSTLAMAFTAMIARQ